jgi:hypothetical protein
MAEEMIKENKKHFIINNIFYFTNLIEGLKNRIKENKKFIQDLSETKEIALSNILLYSSIPNDITNHFSDGGLDIIQWIWDTTKQNSEFANTFSTEQIQKLLKEIKEDIIKLEEYIKLLDDFKRFEPKNYKRIYYH